jgi:hypothetical protein
MLIEDEKIISIGNQALDEAADEKVDLDGA